MAYLFTYFAILPVSEDPYICFPGYSITFKVKKENPI